MKLAHEAEGKEAGKVALILVQTARVGHKRVLGLAIGQFLLAIDRTGSRRESVEMRVSVCPIEDADGFQSTAAGACVAGSQRDASLQSLRACG